MAPLPPLAALATRAAELGTGDAHALAVATLAAPELLTTLHERAHAAADAPAELLLDLEVLLQPGADDGADVPVLAHVRSIAEREGWVVQAELDLTAELQAGRQRLLQAIERHRATLQREGHDVAAALVQLQRRQQALQAGRHGGRRWQLLQATRPRGHAVPMTPAQAPAMRRLFAEIFGHEMTPEHWQWKYGQGHGHAVALLEDGELVGHYGGLTRALRVRGRPMLGCQVCDVMVAPRARRSLARRGPLYRIAADFLETQIGWGLPHQVGFGFPSQRHHGAADRMKLYTGVDRMVQLSWPAQAGPLPPLHVSSLHDADLRHWRAAVDGLWQQMAADLGDQVLGVRDADWLRWRFLQRPGVDYQVLLVRSRWWRRPMGVLVLRRRDDALEWLDVVAPVRHFGLLLSLARARAAQAGLPTLRCWVSASQQQRLTNVAAADVHDLGIEVPACAHTAGPSPDLFKDRWFLFAGDADFT